VLAALFLIGIIFHYPRQILSIDTPSLFAFLGLTHQAVERILFLMPITYAGMFFGVKAGMTSLLIAVAIMLPRIFLISEYRPEAIVEGGAVIVLGTLVNLWFGVKRKENSLYRQLISRLEESEQGLSISEQKYHYLFENASDAIWVHDKDGYFLEGNKTFEKLTGFRVEELKGVQLARFLNEDALKLAKEVRAKLIRGEEFEQPYEQQFYIKDGTMLTIKMSSNPVIFNGEVTGFEHVARDFTQEKQLQENVHSYIQQITRAQEEERKRISRDLHDDVSPQLLILIQKLDKITADQKGRKSGLRDHIHGLRTQAVGALDALRNCAQGLRPRIIDDLGLVAAIEWMVEDLEKDRGITARVTVSGLDRELSPEIQIVLFRIAQEGLNNIRKYAQAKNVSITLEAGEDHITMTVADDGVGFETPERVGDMVSAGRLGLMGMYERARLVHGNLQIISEPGRGTQLVATLPLPAAVTQNAAR